MDEEDAAIADLRREIEAVEEDCWRWCNPCKSHVDTRYGAALVALCPVGSKCHHSRGNLSGFVLVLGGNSVPPKTTSQVGGASRMEMVEMLPQAIAAANSVKADRSQGQRSLFDD